jgi:hypothetical protein
MTAATVAQPNGNGFAVLLVMFLLISFITVVCLWTHERRWDAHERELAANAEQLAGLDYRLESLLEFLGVEVPEPVEDDSPAAETLKSVDNNSRFEPDETPTDEFPAVPATEPSGIPLQVHGALIEARDLSDEFPHPVDSVERKAKNAADIEERLKRFNFAGRNR